MKKVILSLAMFASLYGATAYNANANNTPTEKKDFTCTICVQGGGGLLCGSGETCAAAAMMLAQMIK